MNKKIQSELETKVREMTAKRQRLESDISFMEIEAQGLQNLAAKIWKRVESSPDLTAEEIERWGELTRSYIHAANRINAEITVKVNLLRDAINGLNTEINFYKGDGKENFSSLLRFDN